MVLLPFSIHCGSETLAPLPPELDRCAFQRDVYPLLMRDCAFVGCHGSADRFLRVFGPGRQRIDPNLPLFGEGALQPTEEELSVSYDRTRSMLVGFTHPEDSWLLRKPLDESAGGSAHLGRDNFGRNLYLDRNHPSWQQILQWAKGESAPCP